MLRRAREAHDPTDEGVVAAVGAAGVGGDHLVKAVRRIVTGRRWNINPDGSEPRGSHGDEQRRFRLAAGGKIVKSRAHELMPRQVPKSWIHAPIVGVARARHRPTA